MEHLSALDISILVAAGFTAGVVNVLAGGGSLLTLPALLWLGLPAPVANASNRIGIVLQNVSASTAFHHGGRIPWKPTLLLVLPALPGTLLGAELATRVDEVLFRRILIVVLIFALWGLLRRRPAAARAPQRRHPVLLAAVFFGIGLYAGFLQAGLGLLLLTLLNSLGGFDLVQSNAIKVTFVLILQLAALAIFGLQGQVDWSAGAALALGSSTGAWVSAHWQMSRGTEWVRRAVVVILVVFALRLAWESFLR